VYDPHPSLSFPSPHHPRKPLTQPHRNRQLGHESQAKKDDRHRPHAQPEGGAAQVQERLPDGRAERESGAGECGECGEGVIVTGVEGEVEGGGEMGEMAEASCS